jgi:hypothetical protein
MGTPSPPTSNGTQYPYFVGEIQDQFFAALASSCNVTQSAVSVGISRRRVHQLRCSDKEFAKRFEDAIDQGTDALEAEARRRAKDGFTRPIFYQGKKVGDERLYSDALMITLLKAHRPEKFREKGFDLPPGSEIVIAMRSASDDKPDEAIDVTPQTDKPVKITD